MNRNKAIKTKKGYVALVSMLVVSAVGTAIMLSVLLRGVGSTRSIISFEQSQKAKMFANACAEQALEEIWRADDYAGNGNLGFVDGGCNYSVSGVTVPKTVNATGTVGSVVRKVLVTVDSLHPYVTANPWQEIPDF